MFRIRVALTNLSTGPGVMTFFFAGSLPADATAAASAVHTFLNGIRSRVNDGGSMQIENDVAFINEATGQVTGFTTVTQDVVTGADGGEALPLATQGLLRLRTGVVAAGREIRGRLFIPAPTEGMNTAAGLVDPIYSGQIAAAAAALVATANVDWVVWSRKGGAAAAVNTVSCWNQWAVLRSRRD